METFYEPTEQDLRDYYAEVVQDSDTEQEDDFAYWEVIDSEAGWDQ